MLQFIPSSPIGWSQGGQGLLVRRCMYWKTGKGKGKWTYPGLWLLTSHSPITLTFCFSLASAWSVIRAFFCFFPPLRKTLAKWKWIHSLEVRLRGPWVAQSAECSTWAQVMISRLMSSSPASSHVLTAQSLEPGSDSVSPSLSDPPPIHALSLSVSKINKH